MWIIDMRSGSFRRRICELGFSGPDIDKRTLTLRELMGKNKVRLRSGLRNKAHKFYG